MTKAEILLFAWAALYLFRALARKFMFISESANNIITLVGVAILLILLFREGLFRRQLDARRWVWLVTAAVVVLSVFVIK